ncbi:hypothetical protein MA16_Dca014942 [Dendrobium catenatum]|uniref:Uncharacterized protein n=1 Tax=Dendrobium catenatum TaxID=906689 RepID=A0A2I0W2V2_9ASPA|nr:hypothetical protein MA16_Dca014942 [Dendrobium catenatum]
METRKHQDWLIDSSDNEEQSDCDDSDSDFSLVRSANVATRGKFWMRAALLCFVSAVLTNPTAGGSILSVAFNAALYSLFTEDKRQSVMNVYPFELFKT